MQVRVFARGCESIQLLLNGNISFKAEVNQSNLTAVFTVPYAPGTLTARCVNGSSVVESGPFVALTTATSPEAVRLVADRPTIKHVRCSFLVLVMLLLEDAGAVAV
jgi:hypothetical protein